jgi:anti-sigma28 factor (negative regulator of flagellin synthesis)
MNISKALSAYGATPFESTGKTSKKQAPEKTAALVPKEQVEFSDESQSIQKLREAVDSSPEIRIQLVEDLKEKIKLNGYPIETKLYKALEKMIDTNVV